MACKKPSLSLTVLDNTNDDATCTAAVLGVDISFLKGGGSGVFFQYFQSATRVQKYRKIDTGFRMYHKRHFVLASKQPKM